MVLTRRAALPPDSGIIVDDMISECVAVSQRTFPRRLIPCAVTVNIRLSLMRRTHTHQRTTHRPRASLSDHTLSAAAPAPAASFRCTYENVIAETVL